MGTSEVETRLDIATRGAAAEVTTTRRSPPSWQLIALAFLSCTACVGLTGDDDSDSDRKAPKPSDPRSEWSSCSGSVGLGPLRRIDRQQYDNLVSELLGTSFRPSTVLAPDEKEGPFPANKATLMTRGLAAQYEFIAEQIGSDVRTQAQTLAPCANIETGGLECAGRFIDQFGPRAFRRPLRPEEKTLWVDLYRQTAEDGYATGIRSVVEGMLQSPNFLFRIEAPPPGTSGEPGQVYDLDPYALATRLAFFLWNSGPDEPLLRAAAEGRLAHPEGLVAEVDRMLADPRRLRTFEAFALGWGGLDAIDAATKNPAATRGLDATLPNRMRAETVGFLEAVLAKGDGKLATLFTAPWSVVDPELAKGVYGAAAAADGEGKTWFDPKTRSGVLSHASVLFAHAHTERSSPVLRGKWVREVLLCRTVPDPPPNTNVVLPPPVEGQTTRERYEAHRSQAACKGCHALLDDTGFGFEAYDQVGRFRTMEASKAIDARGTLRGSDVDGDFAGVRELGAKLASSSQAHDCFARQWFRFAMGRKDDVGESCPIDQMSHAVREGAGMRELVYSLVRSNSFRQRRSP